MRNMRIAERIFNRPLLISEPKLQTILQVFSHRSGLELIGGQVLSTEAPAAEMAEISDRERRRAGYVVRNGLAIIGIHGPLMHRVLEMEFPSGGPTTYANLRTAFDMALNDDEAKGIVLDIDSPGGEVNGAFDLAEHIYQSRSIKPITAVVNEEAYSAAYLLASAAEKIVLPRTGGVGSVGVIATHTEFSRWEEENGITVKHIYAGARKADFSQHQPLSNDAEHALQVMVDDTYLLFVETVARNRGLKVQQVVDTEAALFFGKKAVQAKLADEVSAVDKAILKARKGKGTKLIAASVSTVAGEEEREMNTIEELKDQNPDLFALVQEDARKGMIAQADADTSQAEAVAAETTRVMGIVSAAVGEETGTKLQAIVDAKLDADQVGKLGLGVNADNTSGKMLDAITDVAAKGAKPITGGEGKQEAKIDTANIYGDRRKAMGQ